MANVLLDFSYIPPDKLDLSVLEEIIAMKLIKGEPRILSSRLFGDFRAGAQNSQTMTNQSQCTMESLLLQWEDKEPENNRTWGKLVAVLERMKRSDLVRNVRIYLQDKGIEMSSTVQVKEHIAYLQENLCATLTEERHIMSFCIGLFNSSDPVKIAKQDTEVHPQIAGLNVLEEWMQQAQLGAVNDLVDAVRNIRQDMLASLVEYLETFPKTSEGPIKPTHTDGFTPGSSETRKTDCCAAAPLSKAIPTGKTIEDRFLRTISRGLPDKGFNGFAEEFLRLDHATVQQTESNCPKDAQEKIYLLLSMWKNINRGSAETLRSLLQRAASVNAILVSDEVFNVLDSAR